MYSYEDRIKAIRLYLKLGKRLGVTIRQLGYPCGAQKSPSKSHK
jgi:putative transposase